MNPDFVKTNLLIAWLWIVLGFGAGFLLGLFFHKEDWLGGYSSFKRRLYRLAHVSFFGLALVNFLFYATARTFTQASTATQVASWGFIVGAVGMPICCLIIAHLPRLRVLFLIPVLSLLTAGSLTVWEVSRL
jgi:hypothetical protein